MGEKIVRAKAYTSIANLGYGFDAFGLCLGAACDVVTLGFSDGFSDIEVVGNCGKGIPGEWERNTAGLAVRALMVDQKIDRPVRMRIEKGIRPGSGLGSSAASAAAGVVAANDLFDLDLSQTALVGYAAEGEKAAAGTAHADNVAAAVCGGFTIVDQSDRLRLVSLPVARGIRFVVATPDVEVSTEMSRKSLPTEVGLNVYATGCARAGMIVAALLAGDAEALGRAIEGSFVDRARAGLIPGFDEVSRSAREAGALGVTISGAGPTVAAVVVDDGEDVVVAMKRGFKKAGLESEVCVASVGPPACVMEEDA